MEFKVIMRKDDLDGGFNVYCPALPGCRSQGDTIEEAIENIKDAIEGCIAVLNKRTGERNEEGKVFELAASWQSQGFINPGRY